MSTPFATHARRELVRRAALEAVRRLDPRRMLGKPVLLTVELAAACATLLALEAVLEPGPAGAFVATALALCLWATLLLASFAESLAESRSRARVDALRKVRGAVQARRLQEIRRDAPTELVHASQLRRGDLVLVVAGDTIPADGVVVAGIASVDESALTGAHTPVVRESGGDRRAVLAGSFVLGDWVILEVWSNPGEAFIDRVSALVEGSLRRRRLDRTSLDILLVEVAMVLLLGWALLRPVSAGALEPLSLVVLVGLLAAMIPTTLAALIPLSCAAGLDRMLEINVVAGSARAVEAAGLVDVLLLDKAGAIATGNRRAVGLVPAPGVDRNELAEAAQMVSLADETPEGRSVVELSLRELGPPRRSLDGSAVRFAPFSSFTRMGGVDMAGRQIRKGDLEAISAFLRERGAEVPAEVRQAAQAIVTAGGTPLVITDDARVLGVLDLQPASPGGARRRFAALRRAGVTTVMITSDNPVAAAAVAAESGVDDFLAEATPEAKLALIRKYQRAGKVVAMTGDGHTDAPALAQAEVSLAMNGGTQAAREAGSLVDLDADATKVLRVLEVGRRDAATRASLAAFGIGSDLGKCIVVLPAVFAAACPGVLTSDLLGLGSPARVVLAAVLFNALALAGLVPLALRGLPLRPRSRAARITRDVVLFGLTGALAPIAGVKLLDLALAGLRLA